jgi:hypothetical protein
VTVTLPFVPSTIPQVPAYDVLPPSVATNEVTVIIETTTDYIISPNNVISTYGTIVIPASVISNYLPSSVVGVPQSYVVVPQSQVS